LEEVAKEMEESLVKITIQKENRKRKRKEISSHFQLGALIKDTNQYEHPKVAKKETKYTCPGCSRDVIFKQGEINAAHFAHKSSENPCQYYNRPNESQIHKDAKLKLKHLLCVIQEVYIIRSCDTCNRSTYNYNNDCHRPSCSCGFDLDIGGNYNNTDGCYCTSQLYEIVLEYRFEHNGSYRIADVAILQDKQLKFIFEICYKNKTKEINRPEPWIEIDADSLNEEHSYYFSELNAGSLARDYFNPGMINLECIRKITCNDCLKKK
jgi:endogenous inhibitor of DNA gyrase (YacG/DUF329 family)